MAYATLALGRARFRAVEVVVDGEKRRLDESQASDYYHSQVRGPSMAAWAAYQQSLALQRRAREKFASAATIRRVDAPQRGAGRGKPRESFEEVTIEGQAHQVRYLQGEEFVRRLAEERFPDPAPVDQPVSNFQRWYADEAKEVRIWYGELITSNGSTAISLPEDYDRKWGYPVKAVLALLDNLEQQGWKIVHISEDHGVYAGADTIDEAYLARVRYLLSNT